MVSSQRLTLKATGFLELHRTKWTRAVYVLQLCARGVHVSTLFINLLDRLGHVRTSCRVETWGSCAPSEQTPFFYSQL